MPRVVHFEIHGEEPAKLAQFYTGVFGWKTQHLPQLDYWMVDTSEGTKPGINGGLMRRHGPKPADGQAVTSFVCTVEVASVDDYVAKATKAGATLALPKMAIPGVGYVAYCKDPDGNIFGLHQPDAGAK